MVGLASLTGFEPTQAGDPEEVELDTLVELASMVDPLRASGGEYQIGEQGPRRCPPTRAGSGPSMTAESDSAKSLPSCAFREGTARARDGSVPRAPRSIGHKTEGVHDIT